MPVFTGDMIKEECEDTKGVIRILISAKQHNNNHLLYR